VKAVIELGHVVFDQLRGTVWRAIVYHEQMKIVGLIQHRMDHVYDVFFFVVCWNDYQIHGGKDKGHAGNQRI
jgi:hypothetical protein